MNGTVSVRPTVCLSVPSTDSAEATCSWFAGARARAADIDRQLPAPRIGYRSISASRSGQRHVVIRGTEEGRRRLLMIWKEKLR